MIDYYHAREKKKFVLAMEVGLENVGCVQCSYRKAQTVIGLV
jgi:hypothetical protein